MSGAKHTAEPVAYRYHIEGCSTYWYREEIIENPTEAPWVITPLYTRADNPAAFREVFGELVGALGAVSQLLSVGSKVPNAPRVKDIIRARKALAKAKDLQS